jgi:hypothetical protein
MRFQQVTRGAGARVGSIAGALGVAGVLALLFMPGVALADIKPGEVDPGPDSEGHGDTDPQKQKNPLDPILELMRKVQQGLAGADSGSWTQRQQKEIVEALKLGDDAVEQLAKLIEQVESSSQSSGGGGSSSQSGQPQGGSQQKRGQMRQRQADRQQQGVNPQGEQQGEGQQEKRDDQAAQNDQRREGAREPGGDPGSEGQAANGRRPTEADRWGDLPMKQVREVLDSKRGELPPRWRKALEQYYRRLAESQE